MIQLTINRIPKEGKGMQGLFEISKEITRSAAEEVARKNFVNFQHRRLEDWDTGFDEGLNGLGLKDDASLARQLGWRQGSIERNA